jgi:hypothetical protein
MNWYDPTKKLPSNEEKILFLAMDSTRSGVGTFYEKALHPEDSTVMIILEDRSEAWLPWSYIQVWGSLEERDEEIKQQQVQALLGFSVEKATPELPFEKPVCDHCQQPVKRAQVGEIAWAILNPDMTVYRQSTPLVEVDTLIGHWIHVEEQPNHSRWFCGGDKECRRCTVQGATE